MFGLVITVVMRVLAAEPHRPGGAVEIGGDDIPADPPAGEVVERGEAAREQEGGLVGERDGNAETKMFGHRRHRGHQKQRIMRRQLDAVRDGGARRIAENVVRAEHVGQENAVEQTALPQPREIQPVRELGEVGRTVTRMPPQARREMHRRVHGESIEADFTGHRINAYRTGRPSGRR